MQLSPLLYKEQEETEELKNGSTWERHGGWNVVHPPANFVSFMAWAALLNLSEFYLINMYHNQHSWLYPDPSELCEDLCMSWPVNTIESPTYSLTKPFITNLYPNHVLNINIVLGTWHPLVNKIKVSIVKTWFNIIYIQLKKSQVRLNIIEWSACYSKQALALVRLG